jgi:hypothetical protein
MVGIERPRGKRRRATGTRRRVDRLKSQIVISKISIPLHL